MKTQLLLPFYILSFLFFSVSCSVDISVGGSGDDEEEEEITSIEHDIDADLGTLGNVNFDYDECDIDESNINGTLTVNGTAYDKITFKHKLRQGGFSLLINPVFLIKKSSNDSWEDILDSDINDLNNPNFGLEVEVQRSNKNYTSTSTATINGQYTFVYTDDFQYDLTYETDVDSECNDDELFLLSGSISGTLINSNTNGTPDSIQVDISDFALHFIPE